MSVLLNRAVDSVNKVVQLVSRAIHSVGKAVLTVMMLLIFVDVFLRYVFNRPIPDSFGLTEFMLGVVVSLALAYCTVVKGHITVDLVASRFGQRSRAIINTVTGLLGFGLLVLIVWQGFLYIKDMYVERWTSSVLLIPVYPFIAVVVLGLAVYCLVVLIDLLGFLYKAISK